MTITKHTWSEDEVSFLKETYPHFGTRSFLQKFPHINPMAARIKANTLMLRRLPQDQRRCLTCNQKPQMPRYFVCHECFKSQRKIARRTYNVSRDSRFRELLRTSRYRSRDKSDLSVAFLNELWDKQAGLCFYSGLPMILKKFGTGRSPYSVSIDRKDSSIGYLKNNTVLCCWAVNAGKNNFSIEEYVKICSAVVNVHKTREIANAD